MLHLYYGTSTSSSLEAERVRRGRRVFKNFKTTPFAQNFTPYKTCYDLEDDTVLMWIDDDDADSEADFGALFVERNGSCCLQGCEYCVEMIAIDDSYVPMSLAEAETQIVEPVDPEAETVLAATQIQT